MSECLAESEWTIRVNRDATPTQDELLFFSLAVNQGTVTGEVSLGAELLSTVSGTCQSLEQPNITLLNLTFQWGEVNIFLTGYTLFDGFFNRFKGRFLAFAGEINPAFKPNAIVARLAPEPGEGGPGTGQQT